MRLPSQWWPGPWRALRLSLRSPAGYELPAACALAVASYLSVYPALLLLPLVLLLLPEGGSDALRRRAAARCLGAFAAALAGLLLLSYAALGASWEFVTGCYGTLLLLSDLTPTIGLFQPVFVALFDRYHALFLLLVHGHCVGYLVPLGLRFRCGSLPLPPTHTSPPPYSPSPPLTARGL